MIKLYLFKVSSMRHIRLSWIRLKSSPKYLLIFESLIWSNVIHDLYVAYPEFCWIYADNMHSWPSGYHQWSGHDKYLRRGNYASNNNGHLWRDNHLRVHGRWKFRAGLSCLWYAGSGEEDTDKNCLSVSCGIQSIEPDMKADINLFVCPEGRDEVGSCSTSQMYGIYHNK